MRASFSTCNVCGASHGPAEQFINVTWTVERSEDGFVHDVDEAWVTQSFCKACAPSVEDVRKALRPLVSELQKRNTTAGLGGGA